MEKKDNFKFTFLSDKPKNDESELEFGHKELGTTLAEIVEKVGAPFTIGLFGKWGTGKSSLANYLRDVLKRRNIPVVIFDVWKHEKDALRRTFLREILCQLKDAKAIDEKFELNERLDKSIKGNIPTITLPWKKLGKYFLSIVGLFALIIVIDWFFLSSWIFNNILKSVFIYVVGIIVSLGVLFKPISTALKSILETTDSFIKHIFSTKAITYTIDKFTDPHEFQEQFESIIKSMKDKRILIIFDNLDRVYRNKAVEVLSTIKTFLEPSDELIKEKAVVFLVPCDAQALKEHIKAVYSPEITDEHLTLAFDPDEFLRKFFNATIWIPDFIPTELDNYTRNRLKDTGVPDLDNNIISALITIVFRDNPRQIIQFINVLLSNYLLVLERSGENTDFTPNFLSENTASLCRYLLLQHLFPEIMRALKKENISSIDALDYAVLKSLPIIDADAKRFIDIKDRTMNLAPLNKVSRFFYMRRSAEEKEFSDIDQFFVSLEDARVENAQKFIQQIEKYDEQKGSLSRLIKDRIEKIKNPVILARFLDTLLLALQNEAKDVEPSARCSIYTAIDGLAPSNLHLIKPHGVLKIIMRDNVQWRENVIDKWIRLISQDKEADSIKLADDFLMKLLEVFIEQFEVLNEQQKGEIVNSIAQEEFYKEWAGTILTKSPSSENLLSYGFVNGYINGLEERDVIKEILIVTRIANKFIDEDTALILVKKITAVLSLKWEPAVMEDVLLSLNNMIKAKKEILSIVKDQTTWDQLWTSLNQLISAISDWNNRKSIMPICFSLWLVVPQQTKNSIQKIITGFLQNANLESTKHLFGEIDIDRLIEETTFVDLMETRSYASQEYSDYLYDDLLQSENKRYDYLIKLLDGNLPFALGKIRKEHKKLPNEKDLIDNLLSKFDSADAQNELNIIDICNLTRCANNEDLKNILMNKIKMQLTQPNKDQQAVMQKIVNDISYIGSDRLRQMTTAIFDWIKEQAVANNYHILSIKFIYNLQQLSKEEIGQIAYYIFQILRKSMEQSELEIAADILSQLKPKFEDHPEGFNDLKSRIDNEQNASIKNYLIDELLKLKPSKLPEKKNKDFWEQAELLRQEDAQAKS